MQNRIVITKYNDKLLVLFIKEDKLIKVSVTNLLEYSDVVYLGRVQTVKTNISSCFVKYSNNVGYLPSKNLKAETVLPVMVKKETTSNKENELTDIVSLCGIYTLVSNGVKGISFSSRMSKFDKEKISTEGFENLIVRINAKNIDSNSVLNEYNYLKEKLDTINNISDKRTENSILYNGMPKIINTIFSEDYSEYGEILTDEQEVFDTINTFFEEYKTHGIEIAIPLRLYDDSLPLNVLISLSSKMDKATNKTVHLKSDANIVFDYTEAMTVIDVNSGTTRFKGDKAEVIHKINLEAAKEISEQLKLRNISGIIIVDFINEYKKENKEDLLKSLKEYLKDDDCHAKCHGMTKLGLVEVTRNRRNKSLREQFYGNS